MSFKTLIFLGLLFSLLLIRFYLHFSSQNVSKYVDGQAISFFTVLTKEPKVSGRYQVISVAGEKNDQFLVKTSKFPEFHYGETVHISGQVSLIAPSATSSQGRQVPKNNGAILTIYFPQIEASENTQNWPLAIVSSVRQQMIQVFQKTLPPISSSLLLGIVFGIKQEIPSQFNNALRLSGVTHVIAASGMNVTMVGGFLSAMFVLLFKRQTALILTMTGIIFYTLMAGFEASIIRASIMGILAFSAQILGRQTLAVYLLFVTGYLMLFISPNLFSDIGFQLSFLSTLGLLYLKPLFEKGKMKLIIQKTIIGEDLTTTISAQAMTLPILFGNFGTYSLWSVAVNGLVLWTVPILMVFGGLAAIFGFVFEPASRIFLYLSLPFLLYFEKAVLFFANLPGVITTDQSINFPWHITVGYYLILAAIVLFAYRKLR